MSVSRIAMVLFAVTLGVAGPATWSAFGDAPPARVAAAMQTYVFIYRPGPAWRAGEPFSKQGLGPHGAYMKALLERGHIFLAGGFADQDGGMAIVRATNIDEAQRLLREDPAVVSGIFVGEVEGWAPRFRSEAPLN